MDKKSVNVAVLSGGLSNERPISLASGREVSKALAEMGYCVTSIDTADPGYISLLQETKPDIAFLALHGKGGEDGGVQAVCQELGIKFTGSGVMSSALSMNKLYSKIVYRAFGIKTADWIVVEEGEDWSVSDIVEAVGEKMVVKPIDDGSSIGVEVVKDVDELPAAIGRSFKVSKRLLIERFIKGVEVTIPVLGNDTVEAMPVIETVFEDGFYTFDAKYSPTGGGQHIIPARLSEDLTCRCKEQACAVHRALDCRGVSRTDFIIDENEDIWALETNSLPGMRPNSLIGDAARYIGMSFGQLCEKLVELGLE